MAWHASLPTPRSPLPRAVELGLKNQFFWGILCSVFFRIRNVYLSLFFNPLLDLLELVEAHLWLEFRFDSSCFEEVILDQSLEGTILFVLLPCLFLLSVQEPRLGASARTRRGSWAHRLHQQPTRRSPGVACRRRTCAGRRLAWLGRLVRISGARSRPPGVQLTSKQQQSARPRQAQLSAST